MAITRQKKEEILQDLVDKFGRSKSIVFADYRGLDVASISKLRRNLREQDAEMKVAKKTLIGLAAKKSDLGELEDGVMEGPVVTTFSYEDPLSGIRVLFKFSKENENLKLLGGVIDGKVVSPDVIQQYAKLPSHEELLAKFIGTINAPLSGFVSIGNTLVGGIVRALSAYKDTLPADTPTETEAELKEEAKEQEEEQIPPEESPKESNESEEKAPEADATDENKSETNEPSSEKPESEEKPAEESKPVEDSEKAEPAESAEEEKKE